MGFVGIFALGLWPVACGLWPVACGLGLGDYLARCYTCACTCGCRVQGGEARGAPWRASRMANGPWHGSLLPSGFGTVLLSLIFNIKRA
jgi:hypothetical protein